MVSTILKWPIGRPQKQFHATLITKKEIKQEDNEEDENSKSTKTRKTRGTYTNWFAPHLWPSIFVVVNKHGDFTSALHYLKTFHRKLGKVKTTIWKIEYKTSLWMVHTKRKAQTTFERSYNKRDYFISYTFFNFGNETRIEKWTH